ncbi:hypothetical protein Plhal304r1_c002g0008761 [Plasmopara halstedii]
MTRISQSSVYTSLYPGDCGSKCRHIVSVRLILRYRNTRSLVNVPPGVFCNNSGAKPKYQFISRLDTERYGGLSPSSSKDLHS